jgi:hypothetical protein
MRMSARWPRQNNFDWLCMEWHRFMKLNAHCSLHPVTIDAWMQSAS